MPSRSAPKTGLRTVIELAATILVGGTILLTFLGGVLFAIRFHDAGLPVTQALGVVGPERVGVMGISELWPLLVIAAVIAAVATLYFRKRSEPESAPTSWVVASASLLGALVVGVIPLLVQDTIRASGGLEVAALAFPADQRNALALPHRPATEKLFPGTPDNLACDFSETVAIYECYGYYVGTQDGSVVIGVDNMLLSVPMSQLVRFSILSSDNAGLVKG